MKMQKTTLFTEQKNALQVNFLVKKEIIKAFKSLNIDMIENLLSEKGTYFGVSRRIFLAKLRKFLANEKVEFFRCSFGISKGNYPGEIVNEFIYTKNNSDRIMDVSDEFNNYTEKFKEIGSPLSKNQISLKFIYLIENGQIIKICSPSSFSKFSEVKKFIHQN